MLPTTGGGDGLELSLLILSVDEDDTEPLVSARAVDRDTWIVVTGVEGVEGEEREEREEGVDGVEGREEVEPLPEEPGRRFARKIELLPPPYLRRARSTEGDVGNW
jgi:hypothetical protein